MGYRIFDASKVDQKFNYRVIKKEGHFLEGYYKPKISLLGAVNGQILTTSTGHLIIKANFHKFFTLKFIMRHFNLNKNVANLGHFRPIFPN